MHKLTHYAPTFSNFFLYNGPETITVENMMPDVNEKIGMLKICKMEIITYLVDVRLFTPNSHVLDCIVKDVSRFGDLAFLDAFLTSSLIIPSKV